MARHGTAVARQGMTESVAGQGMTESVAGQGMHKARSCKTHNCNAQRHAHIRHTLPRCALRTAASAATLVAADVARTWQTAVLGATRAQHSHTQQMCWVGTNSTPACLARSFFGESSSSAKMCTSAAGLSNRTNGIPIRVCRAHSSAQRCGWDADSRRPKDDRSGPTVDRIHCPITTRCSRTA